MKNKKAGFTLIELLVVIAIISLLAAILFPVFSRARESARRTSCMSNLKQMGVATMQYLQDYDEFFPKGAISAGSPYPDGPGWTNGVWYWQQVLYPYHKSRQVFRCPSSSVNPTHSSGAPTPVYGNYGANRLVFVDESYKGVKASSMNSASNIYMLMDSGSYVITPVNTSSVVSPNGAYWYLPGTGDLGVSLGATALNTTWAPQLKSDFMNGRHLGGVNMAFADGHVKWLPSSVVLAEARKCTTCGVSQQNFTVDSDWNPYL